jgi:CheY-like chemotaxis protein
MKLGDATVLIVDDEAELLEIFSAWLTRGGCKVFTAANGAEALKVLEGVKVQALISDLCMPVMDGVALLRRIHEIGLAMPSLLFVSDPGDVDEREMHELGVVEFVKKPLLRLDLLRALERSLVPVMGYMTGGASIPR